MPEIVVGEYIGPGDPREPLARAVKEDELFQDVMGLDVFMGEYPGESVLLFPAVLSHQVVGCYGNIKTPVRWLSRPLIAVLGWDGPC